MPNKTLLTIYETNARDLTVIKGFTGIIYPFYRSSGTNSSCGDTWFPWMGYFNLLPETEKQLYMVKPSLIDIELSERPLELIKKFLGKRADIFIHRIGNDESLAISCSIGGGLWSEFPELQKAIKVSEAIKPYLLRIEKELTITVEIPPPTQFFTFFTGIQCSASVCSGQAELAKLMERITTDEGKKLMHGSLFSVQDKKEFPGKAVLDSLRTTQTLKHTQSKKLANLGFLAVKLAQLPNPEDTNDFTIK